MRLAPILALILFPSLAVAACPPMPDRSAERAALFQALEAAPTEAEGQAAANRIWLFWVMAPDPQSREWLDEGMDRIRMADYAMAERILGELVAWCPAFAEGWNQRAYARFLGGDLDGSLADIAEVLALEPRHFGALSGKFHILMAQGRDADAQAVLREALKVHPWLGERFLLKPGDRDI
jgi:tetratricopeptide (TPR) repeat protein